MRVAGIFLRGIAMGAADVVPGVSGGTVAFITGIYPRLLRSLHNMDLALARMLLAGNLRGAWRHVDGSFLLALAVGIATSIFSLARLITWLLEAHPQPLWAFFFGLILASAVLLAGQVERWRWRQCTALGTGTLLAVLVAVAPRGELFSGPGGVFAAGFLAICAMILPGISGSFILVLLGMYGVVLAAVSDLDLAFLGIFIAGAGCGLLAFSRLLYWMLSRYRETAVALLTGFLFGSLVAVWPWKRTLEWMVDRHGELRPVQTLPVGPGEFLVRTGQEPVVLTCLLCAGAGLLLVWALDRGFGGLRVELD